MLQGRTYVPMLHARLAEIRALRELPNSTKNKILPIIRIRPWLNSKSLDAVWNKINDAFPERSFGLDLDVTRNIAKDHGAYETFRQLFLPNAGFKNYYDTVNILDWAIPVLRRSGRDFPELENQLEHVVKIGRGLIVRMEPQQSGRLEDLFSALNDKIPENLVFAFDCGWGRDILTQAAFCVSQIEKILNINSEIEIVIGGSSFPDSFAKQGERIENSMIERLLFQEVRRNLNRGQLFYGDWGSTRPPTNPVPMKNVPRIDFPASSSWIAHRSDGELDYESLAENVLADSAWAGGLGIWGEYMIECTAAGLEPAIKSPAMAAAVRVNLHMHIHANLDDPGGMVVGDEPFDDI